MMMFRLRSALKASIVFFILFGVATETIDAKQKISGAFGMTLGQKFDPSSAIGRSALTDGTPMYQFDTKRPFRSFNSYYVMISPITKMVYSIWGIGKIESRGKCKKEQALIVEILRGKYGEPEDEGMAETLLDAVKFDHGNRHIIVKCAGFMDDSIEIRYYDRKLEKLAEKERIKIEAKKVDSSVL